MTDEKITLKNLLANRDALEEISYFNLISLCIDLCKKFESFFKNDVYIHYSDETRVLCDVLNGQIDKDSLLASDILEDGKTTNVSYKYIAPEILNGEENDARSSSLYTLAVLLFRILTLSFPYEGKRFYALDQTNADEIQAFYQAYPKFIFSQNNKENKAVLGSCDNALAFWDVYPDYIKQAFLRVFETDSEWENNRPDISEWLELLKKLKKQLSICTECGVEMFFTDMEKPCVCWRCRKKVMPIEIRLFEGDRVIATSVAICTLERKTELYHLELVVRGMRWGIKNHATVKWKWKKADGSIITVEQNKAVPLRSDLHIELNKNCYLKTRIKEESK